jgi:hypothetical protein
VDIFARYQGLWVFGLSLLTSIGMWMLRSHILNEVAKANAGAASADTVKALDERLDAHDARLASMETALRHLPTAEQMNALTLVVADLRGEVRAMRATVDGVEKMVGATARRVELIDEHLKRGAA